MYFAAALYFINPLQSWRSSSKTHPSWERERVTLPRLQCGALLIDSGVIGERSEWGMDTIAVMYDTSSDAGISCCHLAVERLHNSYCVRLRPDNVEKGLLYRVHLQHHGTLSFLDFLFSFSGEVSFHIHLVSFILDEMNSFNLSLDHSFNSFPMFH